MKLLSNDNTNAVVEYKDHFMDDEDLFRGYIKELEIARKAGKSIKRFNLMQY